MDTNKSKNLWCEKWIDFSFLIGTLIFMTVIALLWGMISFLKIYKTSLLFVSLNKIVLFNDIVFNTKGRWSSLFFLIRKRICTSLNIFKITIKILKRYLKKHHKHIAKHFWKLALNTRIQIKICVWCKKWIARYLLDKDYDLNLTIIYLPRGEMILFSIKRVYYLLIMPFH